MQSESRLLAQLEEFPRGPVRVVAFPRRGNVPVRVQFTAGLTENEFLAENEPTLLPWTPVRLPRFRAGDCCPYDRLQPRPLTIAWRGVVFRRATDGRRRTRSAGRSLRRVASPRHRRTGHRLPRTERRAAISTGASFAISREMRERSTSERGLRAPGGGIAVKLVIRHGILSNAENMKASQTDSAGFFRARSSTTPITDGRNRS